MPSERRDYGRVLRIRVFDFQVLGSDVVTEVGVEGTRILGAGDVVFASIVDNEVAQERPEGIAAGSRSVSQVYLFMGGDVLRLNAICKDSINDEVGSLAINRGVRQNKELDQGGQVIAGRVNAEVFALIKCS
jgi:hypothetical protein